MSMIDRTRDRAYDDPVTAELFADQDDDQPPFLDMIDTTEPAAGQIMRALIEMDDLGFDTSDEQHIQQAISVGRRRHAEHIHTAHLRAERNHRQRESQQHPGVVYYMRVGERVKIGYTTNLTKRIAAVMPEELLATEPGGRLLEETRHRQFAELRTTREWFRNDELLREHIAGLRSKPCAT